MPAKLTRSNSEDLEHQNGTRITVAVCEVGGEVRKRLDWTPMDPALHLRKQPKPFIIKPAPVAQLDRASGFEPEGREFESLRARHSNPGPDRRHGLHNVPKT